MASILEIAYWTNTHGFQYYAVDSVYDALDKLRDLDAAYSRKQGITMSFADLVIVDEVGERETWYDPETGDNFQQFIDSLLPMEDIRG